MTSYIRSGKNAYHPCTKLVAVGFLLLLGAACSSSMEQTTDGMASTVTAGGGGMPSSGAGGSDGGGLGQGGSEPPPFPVGNVYVAGARNAEVFEYDASLKLISRWTDQSFGTVEAFPGQSYSDGPAGMAFNAKGQLVVAALDALCVFSAPNKLLACHPKYMPEPTENIIFDLEGNLYTTTSTGGSNLVVKYDVNFNYVNQFSMKTSQLSGVTCDPNGNLYVASHVGGMSYIYKVDKTTLNELDTIPIQGTVEGIQFASDGNILAAVHGIGILRVEAQTPYAVLETYANPSLFLPVPLTTDTNNRIYTADYENGQGTAPADLIVFDPANKTVSMRMASEVWGPFGMVVAGAVLPCGAFQPPK